eukprot:COSAG06_NODE_6771_length_2788_cov_60.304202_4_plen_87_part_00
METAVKVRAPWSFLYASSQKFSCTRHGSRSVTARVQDMLAKVHRHLVRSARQRVGHGSALPAARPQPRPRSPSGQEPRDAAGPVGM